MLFAATATTKSGTAIQEPESGSGSGIAHNLCKLAHFITAGHISNKIFQGGGLFRDKKRTVFMQITLAALHAYEQGGINLVYCFINVRKSGSKRLNLIRPKAFDGSNCRQSSTVVRKRNIYKFVVVSLDPT